jgi:EAL domain-containing protein (putative c-di-GMP-specific phosphodiesterase class I)
MGPGNKVSSIVGVGVAHRRATAAALTEADHLARLLTAQSDIVRAGRDPHKVVDVVTQRAQELTRSSGAVVEILDGDELVYWSASGTAVAQLGLHVRLHASIAGLCVQTGHVLRCDDSEADPRVDRAACRHVGLRSVLVAPLSYENTIIGVLKVISPEVRAYGPEDVRTLELLSDLIGTTLGNAIHHAAMETELNSKVEADRLAAHEMETLRESVLSVIDEDAFSIVYQPVVELASRQVLGMEALARFSGKPYRSPDRWFKDAAQIGLGVPLELATARHALAALPSIPPDVYLSINVSPETALTPDLEHLCSQHDLGRIVLEITEHSFVEDYPLLAERMRSLRARGLRLAIDDAGAGFASLRHVLRLEPDFIKLDISITRDIDRQSRQQSLASAMLIFAAGSSAALIAEGIETEAEAVTLGQLGIRFGQGHHLGYPEALPGVP